MQAGLLLAIWAEGQVSPQEFCAASLFFMSKTTGHHQAERQAHSRTRQTIQYRADQKAETDKGRNRIARVRAALDSR